MQYAVSRVFLYDDRYAGKPLFQGSREEAEEEMSKLKLLYPGVRYKLEAINQKEEDTK